MKITKQEDKQFKPVSFTVTLETEEEFKAIHHCIGFNMTLPSFLRDQHSVSVEHTRVFQKFLTDVYNTVKEG